MLERVLLNVWAFKTLSSTSVFAFLERILPQQRALPQGGRPPLENYRALCRIIFRLRTGCQWKAVPRPFESPSAVHKRFQEWVEMGVMERVFYVFVRIYDCHKEIDWEWMSVDSATTKAPMGGSDTGPSPTDRRKKSSKRHVLADSCGAPVAVETSAANTHDSRLVGNVIDKLPEDLSDSMREDPVNICLDKAYDSKVMGRLYIFSRRAATTRLSGTAPAFLSGGVAPSTQMRGSSYFRLHLRMLPELAPYLFAQSRAILWLELICVYAEKRLVDIFLERLRGLGLEPSVSPVVGEDLREMRLGLFGHLRAKPAGVAVEHLRRYLRLRRLGNLSDAGAIEIT